MAVWRLQVNTGGANVADYCLRNHVAAMGWSLRELTQAERSGIHTFLDYCNLARTQYTSFDSVCRMVEDVKEGDLLWMRSRNEGKYYIARDSEYKGPDYSTAHRLIFLFAVSTEETACTAEFPLTCCRDAP